MSYRDELGAAQSRIEALEGELGEAQKRVGQLEESMRYHGIDEVGTTALQRIGSSEQGLALASRQRTSRRWLGAPTQVGGIRELDFEIDEAAFARVVDYLRSFYGSAGTVTIMAGSFTWAASSPAKGTGPFVTIYMTAGGGKTTVRAEQSLGNTAGAIFGGIGGGVGGGAIMAPGALFFVSVLAGAVAVPLWFAGTYWACRKLFQRSARKAERRMNVALDQLCRVAEESAKRLSSPT